MAAFASFLALLPHTIDLSLAKPRSLDWLTKLVSHIWDQFLKEMINGKRPLSFSFFVKQYFDSTYGISTLTGQICVDLMSNLTAYSPQHPFILAFSQHLNDIVSPNAIFLFLVARQQIGSSRQLTPRRALAILSTVEQQHVEHIGDFPVPMLDYWMGAIDDQLMSTKQRLLKVKKNKLKSPQCMDPVNAVYEGATISYSSLLSLIVSVYTKNSPNNEGYASKLEYRQPAASPSSPLPVVEASPPQATKSVISYEPIVDAAEGPSPLNFQTLSLGISPAAATSLATDHQSYDVEEIVRTIVPRPSVNTHIKPSYPPVSCPAVIFTHHPPTNTSESVMVKVHELAGSSSKASLRMGNNYRGLVASMAEYSQNEHNESDNENDVEIDSEYPPIVSPRMVMDAKIPRRKPIGSVSPVVRLHTDRLPSTGRNHAPPLVNLNMRSSMPRPYLNDVPSAEPDSNSRSGEETSMPSEHSTAILSVISPPLNKPSDDVPSNQEVVIEEPHVKEVLPSQDNDHTRSMDATPRSLKKKQHQGVKTVSASRPPWSPGGVRSRLQPLQRTSITQQCCSPNSIVAKATIASDITRRLEQEEAMLLRIATTKIHPKPRYRVFEASLTNEEKEELLRYSTES